ncbi:MAG: cysteine peptidase family C39 domain-containing protein [Actinomycetes bacterium]
MTAPTSPETDARVARRHRTKVPTVLQMEATECGAASLAMVAGYYGKVEPLDKLRELCGVARDGASAASVLTAGHALGMKGKAYKRELNELKSMTFPLIIHWRFYHYLVVEGWYPGGWYLNDPAGGPRNCDDREFDESFTGITLELVPGPEFEEGGKRSGITGRLAAAAGRLGPAIAMALLAGLLLIIPTLLVPQLLSLYGEELTSNGSKLPLAILGGLLLALVIQTVLLALQGSLTVRLATKISIRLGASVVQKLLQLPASFHAQRGAAAISQRALLIDSLSEKVSEIVVNISTGALTGLAAAIVLLLIDPLTGIVALAVTIILALALQWSIHRTKNEASKVVVQQVEVGAVMSASLSQVESIKASGTEDGIIAHGVAAENRLLEANQRIGLRMLWMNLLPPTMSGIGFVIISGVAMYGVISGRTSYASLIAILALIGVLMAPVPQIVASLSQSQLLRAVLDQVDDVLDANLESEWPEDSGPEAPSSIRGELEARGLTFGYSRLGKPVISDVNLHIAPGQRVALVGPSGCGKSTLSRLVTGLYQPWSGDLLIDGLPRREHAPSVITDGVALVDQDVTIFAGTIRDNVTLWDPTIPDRDILSAIDDAQLADDVAARPGGLDAILLEGGKDLSGGQRQRLEIARALARKPAILVLDEATSALDATTEQRIDAAIRRRGITCLVIAHRLSTIRDSDELIVLDNGSVVERGTHDELMIRNGAYARLVGSG